MNIIDAIIILMILLAGVIGLKRGFFKEIVITIGWILVFIISWKLKSPLAEWFSLNLPFFKFWGAFYNVTVINIVLYQFLAFLIIYCILMIGFRLILYVTGAFEKILNMTIILGIPSKILGFIVGLIEGYILVFIALFILTQPIFNIDIINESKMTPTILKSTPGLGRMVKSVSDSAVEIYEIRYEYSSNSDKNEFNKESVRIMLKHGMIDVKYVEKLVSAGKLNITGINEVLNEYR